MGPRAHSLRFFFAAKDIGALAGSDLFHQQGLGGAFTDLAHTASVPIVRHHARTGVVVSSNRHRLGGVTGEQS